MTTTPENSLGLQLEQLQITDTEPVQPVSPNAPRPDESPQTDQSSDSFPKEKKKQKPYINPERFKTGGPQREKPSDEELAERMERIKAQNERIKQRRLDVEADEEAFRKTEHEERIKIAEARKTQETVNRAREQNARRKLEKMQNREWDSGKAMTSAVGRPESQWPRGGSKSRSGPGRGRGGNRSFANSTVSKGSEQAEQPPST